MKIFLNSSLALVAAAFLCLLPPRSSASVSIPQGPGGEIIARPPNPPVHSPKPASARPVRRSPRSQASRNSGASAVAAQIETIIDAANKAREGKAYEEARSLYQSVLKLSAKEARAYYGIGNTLLDQRRWQEAAAAYKQATALQPDLADAYLYLGSIYGSEFHRYADAIDAFDHYVKLKPDDAQGWYRLAESYQEAERLDEAIATYKRVLPMSAQNDFFISQGYLNLGHLYLQKKEYDQAVATLREGIRRFPSSTAIKTSYFYIGIAYFEQGRYREAVPAFDDARYLYYPIPYYYLGLTYLKLNNRAAANEMYQDLRYIQNTNHIPYAGVLADKLLAEINRQ